MTAPALPPLSRRDAEVRALLIPLVEECAWDEVLAIVTARRREISQTRQTRLERLFIEFMDLPADERPDFYTFAHQRRVPTVEDFGLSALDDFDAPAPEPEIGDPSARLKLELNDLGNAQRLAIGLKEDALYTDGTGWLLWDGTRFSPIAGAERMRQHAGRMLVRMIEEEAAAQSRQPVAQDQLAAWMAEKGETDRAAAERKIKASRKARRRAFAHACGNMAKVRSAMDAAAALFLTRLEDLDADRTLLQLPNGTLRLGSIAEWPEAEEADERVARWRRALGKHDRASKPTRVGGCPFDPDATAPEWERFIGIVMPDAEMRRYLQVLCGFLLGGQENERAAFLLGKGGNGKSTVVKAIAHVLGDYAQTCRIEMFCEQRNVGNGPTPEEAVLPGARVYLAAEPDTQVTLSASRMKGMTGGDARQANPKNKAVFTYRPVGVPVLQANAMPNVNDPSDGFWRRVYPVLFEVRLADLEPGERRTSSEMDATIRREAAGILNWMLEGWALYRAEGVNVPARAAALKGSLQALADPVGQFLSECAVLETGARTRTAELHKAFVEWSEAQGAKPMGARPFKRQMLARDHIEAKIEGHWFWRSVRLLAAPQSGDEPSPDRREYERDFR